MGEPFLADEDGAVYVVGPVSGCRGWTFLCPVCDDDRIEDVGDQPEKLCTQEWLHGRDLAWESHTWTCWVERPLPDVEAHSKRQRYLYYRAIARELRALGRRVQLPGCVEAKVEELHGDSQVGFTDRERDGPEEA